jgi:pimeloyl-ACP methyl ester carboxylesterase
MPPPKPRPPSTPPVSRHSHPPEVVDPIWLLKALAVCLAAALICGYATLCLLFYQGRWQLVLHPSHVVDRTPATAGLAYSDVRFGASETGQPRLAGWWIPAGAQAGFTSRYSSYTVLYLHDGLGSLADTVPMLTRLHSAGLNVLAMDYRGFGASDASAHPSQERMSQDTADALEYLTSTRHIPFHNVIPYGLGLGAFLAARLAQEHPELPAVILDNPDPDPAETAIASHPSHIVPVRLLFGDSFDLRTPIATLTIPKLLIAGGPNSNGTPDDLGRLQTLFRRAASPSMAVTLPPSSGDSQYEAALSRFLDQYLSTR